MKTTEKVNGCGCDGGLCSLGGPARQKKISFWQLNLGFAGIAVWYVLYLQLLPFSNFFAYHLLQLDQGSQLGASIQFFVYDTPKVMLLLTLIVFVVGMIRSFFTPERTRMILAGRRESVGNVLSALLGIVTPFCSCSAVPLFIGFVQAGVPLGVVFLSHRRPHGQRNRRGAALRPAGLEDSGALYGHRAYNSHRGRLGHRPAES